MFMERITAVVKPEAAHFMCISRREALQNVLSTLQSKINVLLHFRTSERLQSVILYSNHSLPSSLTGERHQLEVLSLA
ncbi:hypothetical protein R1flu_025430 [Riccia fluitans]|uniref:Uncharacterized protein n=1 Tax=Riccia fluitans TaxID=41844 RepID=A0ABD1Y1V7_9MARC